MKHTFVVPRPSPPALTLLTLLFTLLLGVIDYRTGTEISLSVFYLLPIMALTWYRGRWAGYAIAAVSALTWMAADVLGGAFHNPFSPVWNTVIRFGVYVVVVWLLSAWKSVNEQLESRVEERTAALRSEMQKTRLREEALRETQLRLATLLDSLPSVVLYESGGGREFISDNVEALLGFPAARFNGDPEFFPSLIHPDDRDRVRDKTLSWHQAGESGVLHLEFRCRRADASYRWLEDYLVSVKPEGQAQYVAGVLVDVTGRRELEDQLRESQKLEAIGALAGGVAHDFNNMLNIIAGFTELAREQVPADHPAQESLQKVYQTTGRAAEVVRKLLAFSRRQILQVELINLNRVLDEFLEMFTRIVGEDVEVVLRRSPEPLPVKADASQIENVLLNLGTNARQAMPTGGKLVLQARKVTLDSDFVAAHPWAQCGEFAYISMTDTGVGMSPATMRRIFDPFFTTKPGGSGLGLAMVYGIVKQHNGLIHVYSELGRGSTFHVYLPLQSGAVEEPVEERPAAPARGTETVLIAEDETLVRELLATYLRQQGYTVVLAENGDEAVRRFEENPDAIAIVVLDAVMPKSGGAEALVNMRARRPGLKAVLISGYAPDSTQLTDLLGKQRAVLIQKPFSPRTLAIKVRELLDTP